MFYICQGQMPVRLLNEPIKGNRSFDLVVTFTSIVHTLLYVRLIVYKLSKKKNPGQETPSVRRFLKLKFNKDAITRFVNKRFMNGLLLIIR